MDTPEKEKTRLELREAHGVAGTSSRRAFRREPVLSIPPSRGNTQMEVDPAVPKFSLESSNDNFESASGWTFTGCDPLSSTLHSTNAPAQ
jgi:hypothetical protein